MRHYIKEIIGRTKSHSTSEDSYAINHFNDADGLDWRLFMIADGLTSHNGAYASNFAVKTISAYIRNSIESKSGYESERVIKDALLQTNSQLEKGSAGRTTIDMILLSSSELYLAHLGDSRVYFINDDNSLQQVTKDEGGGPDGPTNYLGRTYAEGSSIHITDRVEKCILKPYEAGLVKPKFILLATDGLTSRVTDEEIETKLSQLGKYSNPAQLLDELEQMMRYPVGRMGGLTLGALWNMISNLPEFAEDTSLSIELLRTKLLQAYKNNESDELVRRIDNNWIKNDDTAMILVDLEDSVDNRLGELKTVVEVTLPRVEQKRDEYQQDVVAKSATISRLETTNSNLEERLAEEKEGRRVEKEAYDAKIKLKDREIEGLYGGVIDYEVNKDELVKEIAELKEEIVNKDNSLGLYAYLKRCMSKFYHGALRLIASGEYVKKKDESGVTELISDIEAIALISAGYNREFIEKNNQELSDKKCSLEKTKLEERLSGRDEVIKNLEEIEGNKDESRKY